MATEAAPPSRVGPEADVDPEETIDLLLRHLGTRAGGLTQREAERRLQQHGANEIRRREGPGHLRELARQFTHPLALLLWVAGALARARPDGASWSQAGGSSASSPSRTCRACSR
jgi:magnesium-transporting ATPase (P-type)